MRITAKARAIKPPGHQHSLYTGQPGRIRGLDLKERFRQKELRKISLTGVSLISQAREPKLKSMKLFAHNSISSELQGSVLRSKGSGLSAPPPQIYLLRTPLFRLPESPLLSYSGMESLPAQHHPITHRQSQRLYRSVGPQTSTC